MSIVHIVRFPASIEQHKRVEELHPGLYERIIAMAREYGLVAHRRVYRDNELMDIDEWESEEGMKAFAAAAAPLLKQIAETRGSGPPTVESWTPFEQAP